MEMENLVVNDGAGEIVAKISEIDTVALELLENLLHECSSFAFRDSAFSIIDFEASKAAYGKDTKYSSTISPLLRCTICHVELHQLK